MAKWERGEAIRIPETVFALILDGRTLFHNHKAQNAAWLRGWPLNLIEQETISGRIFWAIRTEEKK